MKIFGLGGVLVSISAMAANDIEMFQLSGQLSVGSDKHSAYVAVGDANGNFSIRRHGSVVCSGRRGTAAITRAFVLGGEKVGSNVHYIAFQRNVAPDGQVDFYKIDESIVPLSCTYEHTLSSIPSTGQSFAGSSASTTSSTSSASGSEGSSSTSSIGGNLGSDVIRAGPTHAIVGADTVNLGAGMYFSINLSTYAVGDVALGNGTEGLGAALALVQYTSGVTHFVVTAPFSGATEKGSAYFMEMDGLGFSNIAEIQGPNDFDNLGEKISVDHDPIKGTRAMISTFGGGVRIYDGFSSPGLVRSEAGVLSFDGYWDAAGDWQQLLAGTTAVTVTTNFTSVLHSRAEQMSQAQFLVNGEVAGITSTGLVRHFGWRSLAHGRESNLSNPMVDVQYPKVWKGCEAASISITSRRDPSVPVLVFVAITSDFNRVATLFPIWFAEIAAGVGLPLTTIAQIVVQGTTPGQVTLPDFTPSTPCPSSLAGLYVEVDVVSVDLIQSTIHGQIGRAYVLE